MVVDDEYFVEIQSFNNYDDALHWGDSMMKSYKETHPDFIIELFITWLEHGYRVGILLKPKQIRMNV